MSVTYGFFNSVNGDRKYNAEQMSSIFNGIINDGVFMNIGNTFGVSASTGLTVTIGIGRAWFNSTWILNDALYPITLDSSEVLLDRIDAIVIEVNHSIAVRAAMIKMVKGTPGATPQRPNMLDTEYIHQHPLAYIIRKSGSTKIVQADITNMIGTSSCPFVTSVLEITNIDNIVAQWQAQWSDWTAEEQNNFDIWIDGLQGLIGNDLAANLTDEIFKMKLVTKIQLKASAWTGTSAPYVQTVRVGQATEKSEATLVRALPSNASIVEQQEYNKAFGIVSSGTGSLGYKTATFRVYKKPEIDIIVGLKGIVQIDGQSDADREAASERARDIVNWTPEYLIKKMGPGWNLGNTLDAWHANYTTPDTSYWETLWGNPVTTMAMIREVKNQGYNTVRIPVTWRANLNSNGVILDSWLKRVEEVINYVLDCDMFCIINVHHDTGVDGNLTAELDKVYGTMYNLENLWKQIAAYFSRYDYRLMFEGFNELVNPTVSNVWLGDSDSYKAVNMLNQKFVDVVRGISGNENRFLLCAPYGAQYQEPCLSAFEMPYDSAENKIIVRVNMYHSNRFEVFKTLYPLSKYITSRKFNCIITELGIVDYDDTPELERLDIIKWQTKEYRMFDFGMCSWNGNLDRVNLIWLHNDEVEITISGYLRYRKQEQKLNRAFNLMDINNYRNGEYGFGSGVYGETNTKVCFITYMVPVYDKYTVVTTVDGMNYMITQMDEKYNYLSVAIRGNYGGFDVEPTAKYLGITLYNDADPYSLEKFKTLLETNTLNIVPRDDASPL